MAFIQYLKFDGRNLSLSDSYSIDLSDVVADSGGETEAGTTQRDVGRRGVVSISVSFSVSAKWLSFFSAYAKKDKNSVQYFDTEELALKESEMYISSYKANLEKIQAIRGCGRFLLY